MCLLVALRDDGGKTRADGYGGGRMRVGVWNSAGEHGGTHVFGELAGAFERCFREEGHEFFPAIAGSEIAGALCGGVKRLGYLFEASIAGLVSIVVVEGFEMVNVGKNKA